MRWGAGRVVSQARAAPSRARDEVHLTQDQQTINSRNRQECAPKIGYLLGRSGRPKRLAVMQLEVCGWMGVIVDESRTWEAGQRLEFCAGGAA